MKLILYYTMITFSVITMFSSSAFAEYYYATGVGDGGSAKTNSFTLETGKYTTNTDKINYLYGISVPFIDHGDIKTPTELINSPSPHNDYSSLGRKCDGLETGILGKAGLGFFSGRLFLSLTGGFTQSNIGKIVKSNAGEHYYKQSEERKIYRVYGTGLSYFHEFFDWGLKMNFQVDYDNRRGVTGCVGWSW